MIDIAPGGGSPVMVFVWQAEGKYLGSGGVTDDSRRARMLGRQSLLATGADEVIVEEAFSDLGVRTLTTGYSRTGHGWRGHRTKTGRVTWRKF